MRTKNGGWHFFERIREDEESRVSRSFARRADGASASSRALENRCTSRLLDVGGSILWHDDSLLESFSAACGRVDDIKFSSLGSVVIAPRIERARLSTYRYLPRVSLYERVIQLTTSYIVIRDDKPTVTVDRRKSSESFRKRHADVT